MCDREIKVVGLGFALLRQDNGLQTTDNGRGRQPELWNYGFTDLRKYGNMEIWNYGKLASLCYAKTTDNGRAAAGSLLIAHNSQLLRLLSDSEACQ